MEYERRVEIASLDWRNNLLGLPKWSERPKCGCRDRWQVATSFAEQTFGRRYFVCPNVDNDFVVCLTVYKIRYDLHKITTQTELHYYFYRAIQGCVDLLDGSTMSLHHIKARR